VHQKNLKLFCRSRDYIDYTFINFETDEYEIRLVVNHKSIITARCTHLQHQYQWFGPQMFCGG